MTDIREDYEDYSAPPWVRPTVERLLESLPPAQLAGLAQVVLTNSARSRPRLSRRNRRVRPLGLYRPQFGNQPASIDLIVDEIVGTFPWLYDKLQITREHALATVFFHEVGHHLDVTIGSLGREPESSAVRWEKQLTKAHMKKRYGYLRPFARVLRPAVSSLLLIRRFLRRR